VEAQEAGPRSKERQYKHDIKVLQAMRQFQDEVSDLRQTRGAALRKVWKMPPQAGTTHQRTKCVHNMQTAIDKIKSMNGDGKNSVGGLWRERAKLLKTFTTMPEDTLHRPLVQVLNDLKRRPGP
jgi:hypothetical protein